MINPKILIDFPFAKVQIDALRDRCTEAAGKPVYGIHSITKYSFSIPSNNKPYTLPNDIFLENKLLAILDVGNRDAAMQGPHPYAIFDPESLEILYYGE